MDQMVETLENTETFSPTEKDAKMIPSTKVVPQSAKFSASRTELVTGEFSSEEKTTAADKQKANIEQSSSKAIQKTVQLTHFTLNKTFSLLQRPSLVQSCNHTIEN